VNRGPADMTIVIIQNTSAPEDKDNIGIGESLSRLPPRVLSAVFGVPAETFSSFKKIDNAIVILRSPWSTLAAVVRPSPAAPAAAPRPDATPAEAAAALGVSSPRPRRRYRPVGRSTCDLNRTG
jgi:hypothetical protein